MSAPVHTSVVKAGSVASPPTTRAPGKLPRPPRLTVTTSWPCLTSSVTRGWPTWPVPKTTWRFMAALFLLVASGDEYGQDSGEQRDRDRAGGAEDGELVLDLDPD